VGPLDLTFASAGLGSPPKAGSHRRLPRRHLPMGAIALDGGAGANVMQKKLIEAAKKRALATRHAAAARTGGASIRTGSGAIRTGSGAIRTGSGAIRKGGSAIRS
jgi:hypothetical protein